MAGPFRSDTSASTTLTVTLSNLARGAPTAPSTLATCTINWSVTLGSASSLGSATNRTLYIYKSGGGVLGSAIIKNGVAWNASTTYSGSFNISFDAATYNAFNWNFYSVTDNAGSTSCAWTNRTYCTDFAYAFPLYWSNCIAPTVGAANPNIFENTVRLSWSAGTDGINNPISQYHCYYAYSDDGGGSWSSEIGVASLGSYIDVDTSAWARGRLLKYHVASISTYNNPWSAWCASNAKKNSLPNTPSGTPSTDKAVYTPSEIITVVFSPNATPDPDGNLAGYEVAMQDGLGAWYNSGAIVGSKVGSGAPYTVSVSTTGWTAGQSWKFFVRGYDALGVRGAWSAATALVLMGVPFKVEVGGAWKDSCDAQVLIGGVWKQIVEIQVLVGGVWKALSA